MTTPARSPGRKALEYAENQLGVHQAYRDALAARDALDKTLTLLSETRDRKRDIEFRLQDAEMEVAAAERGKHPDMSATAMQQHLKQKFFQTDEIRELREQMGKVSNDIDGLECDRQISETDIKIATARMNELSGYLQYLAVIKKL